MALRLTTYEDVKIETRRLSVFSDHQKVTLTLPKDKVVEVNLSAEDIENLIYMLEHASD